MAARPAAFCALRFRPLPWAVLAVAPTGPFLLVTVSAPATLLDFQAALGTVSPGDSERGISQTVRVLAQDKATISPPVMSGLAPPHRVTYLLRKVR